MACGYNDIVVVVWVWVCDGVVCVGVVCVLQPSNASNNKVALHGIISTQHGTLRTGTHTCTMALAAKELLFRQLPTGNRLVSSKRVTVPSTVNFSQMMLMSGWSAICGVHTGRCVERKQQMVQES